MTIAAIQKKWFEAWCPNPGADLRLFCFPYSGGAATIYRAWSKGLPSFIEVLPVQLPGRGNRYREQPIRRLSTLVDQIVEDLHPVFQQKPFAFFGHSMGAVVAFEVARRLLKDYNVNPQVLFVSGRPAPQLARDKSYTYALADDEFIAELRRMNGTPQAVIESQELMQLLLPILRADFEAIQTYEFSPSGRLSSPIVAFGGRDDKDVPKASLEAWRYNTIAGFAVSIMPGDHFFLHPQQNLLLQVVGRELTRFRERRSSTSFPGTGSVVTA